jgi:hypothetical protein
MSAMITMFEGESRVPVHEQINDFLAEHGYDVWDVPIHFVARSVPSSTGYHSSTPSERFVAYVTHPAN